MFPNDLFIDQDGEIPMVGGERPQWYVEIYPVAIISLWVWIKHQIFQRWIYFQHFN